MAESNAQVLRRVSGRISHCQVQCSLEGLTLSVRRAGRSWNNMLPGELLHGWGKDSKPCAQFDIFVWPARHAGLMELWVKSL